MPFVYDVSERLLPFPSGNSVISDSAFRLILTEPICFSQVFRSFSCHSRAVNKGSAMTIKRNGKAQLSCKRNEIPTDSAIGLIQLKTVRQY